MSGEEEEVSGRLLFRLVGNEGYEFYIADDKDRSQGWEKTLDRTSLPPTPESYFHSSCTVVGNIVYVIGGGDVSRPFENAWGLKIPHIFYIPIPGGEDDDQEGEGEWRKGRRLHRGRAKPYALDFHGNLLVMSGLFEVKSDCIRKNFAELWNVREKQWIQLNPVIPSHFSPCIDGHAVLDDDRILFHGRESDMLYCFHVGAGTVEVYSQTFGQHRSSAFIDGVIYTMASDYYPPARMFGFIANNPDSPLYPVTLSNPQPDDTHYYHWLPESRDEPIPVCFMVQLSHNCLALLWEEKAYGGSTYIYCSKWIMSKKKKKKETGGTEWRLSGRPISITRYLVVRGGFLEDCLAL